MKPTTNSALPILLIFSASLFCAADILAQAQRGFHLFNPTPKEGLREFSIDRPDVTESPITVDAGHFQFEGDLVKWNKDNQGESFRTYNIFNGLYKMGLTHSWDIHIGVELYNIYQNPDKETIDKGYGATTVRLKHNFWGNDGDQRTALGMIPYVTFLEGNPFDSEKNYGVGFPFSYSLNDKLDLGAQPQIDFIYQGEDRYDVSYFQTIVLGGALIGDLDFYLEGLAIFTRQNQFLTNGGLIYNVSPNVKVDIAANVGLNNPSPTRVYLGLSFRI